ncbi:hypothetical protein, partial [Cryobacterium lactosi]|uniref:hypothetical protein n=1 Tax=Cryobacterium lactosi TaxID=1259202 RepID=UPI001A7EC9D9
RRIGVACTDLNPCRIASRRKAGHRSPERSISPTVTGPATVTSAVDDFSADATEPRDELSGGVRPGDGIPEER